MRPASVALLAVFALAGCSGGAASTASDGDAALRVFAASSLTDAFGEIEAAFEAANPGVDVHVNFAGSADLAAQIKEGAPADVFASANESQMRALGDSVTSLGVFATNTLTIVVPADNPAAVAGLSDLASRDVRLVVCAPQVPCGAATQSLARAQGVALHPVSEESNVTDVLGKVASGEADAGIVYETDLARAEGVQGIELAGADQAVNRYVIGTVAGSSHADLAADFVAWVLSDAGQSVLASYGFGSP